MSDDTKTYFGCFSMVAIYAALWFFLVPIADDWGMNRVFFGIVNLFLMSLVYNFFSSIYEKHEESVLEEKRNKCKRIKDSYPNAYENFCENNHIDTKYSLSKFSADQILEVSYGTWSSKEKELIERKERIKRENKKAEEIKQLYPKGFEVWKKKYNYTPSSSVIVSAENEIKSKEKNIIEGEKYEAWEKKQIDHAKYTYDTSKDVLPRFGRYVYNIAIDKVDKAGQKGAFNYKVWQSFPHSVCLENDVNYDLCKYIKDNTDCIEDYKNCKLEFGKSFIQQICNLINVDSIGNEITVVFNDCIEGWNKDAYDFHYKPIIDGLESDVKIEWFSNLRSQTNNNFNEKEIVIIDIFTTNDNLKKICTKVIKHFGNGVLLSYISLLKCYDRSEILKLITKKEEEKAKKIKEEQDRRRKQKEKIDAINNIPLSVSEWDKINGVLPYKHLLYYYPTTCEFEANEEEWADRWIVWDFKNTPGKTSNDDHERALNNVIPRLSTLLKETFGVALEYLTLVCIPASSQEKTIARYKEFSERLCNETGMINSFNKIKVQRAAEEKHTGGNGLSTSDVYFDEDFFKNKRVILFDDVITKGNSMIRFRTKMRNLGAHVVCGLSIGKTKHERVYDNTIPRPKHPFLDDDDEWEPPF